MNDLILRPEEEEKYDVISLAAWDQFYLDTYENIDEINPGLRQDLALDRTIRELGHRPIETHRLEFIGTPLMIDVLQHFDDSKKVKHYCSPHDYKLQTKNGHFNRKTA